MADASGYDPKRSKVSDKTMANWRQLQITGDLKEVPGIGDAAVQKLAMGATEAERITNTYQLFGMFLMLKGPDGEDGKVNSFEHMEKFWQFLKRKGISSHRSAIVKAIAEKAATFFVGIYDENLYEDDDDEDEDE